MSDFITIAKDELANLEERVRKLATEKAYLQLLTHLMNKLSAVPGLENTIESMLKTMIDNIGGTNLMIYYVIDNEIHYVDVSGRKMKLAGVDDVLVKEVFETRRFIEQEHDFSDTKMMTPEFTKAITWVFPLLVGPDLIGVFKMEGMCIGARELRSHLELFFNYAALILKNEILGHTRLQKAFDQLSKANTELTNEISVRRRAEEALMRIQKAVESSGEAIGMSDPQGRHFYHNKAFHDLFEYSIEELNKPLAPVVVYADPEVGRAVFATIIQGSPWVGETIMVAKNGRRFPVFLRADAVKDDNNNIIGLIGIHTDITERKLAEEKLNNQMNFISTLLDTIPNPIFYKDVSGKYLGCNRAYEKITGKSREEIVGKDIYELYPAEIANLYAKKDRELYEHPGSQIYDGKFNAADGKVRDVIISKATYTDTSMNVAGVVGIFIDITARKRAEQMLSEEIALKNFLLDLFKKASSLTDKDLYDYVLDYVVRITGSTIGFFHLVSDDQKNVILTAWNNEALKNCTAAYETHYPLEQAGNWLDCVRLMRPVVYNDFPSSPNRKGLPEGHTPVSRFMSVPVVEGDKVRIIFGVGNKSEDYDELDANRIQVVANELQRIMAQRQAEEEIRTLSITDQLTGLHNRRGFITFADQQLKLSDRTKRGMLLFFADLDEMKWINDTFGHEEGDRALMEAAAILKETFRAVDIVARMGGDEFAILAIDSTEVNSEIFSTRLQERIDAHNQQENRRYRLSLSVGCACYDPENPCSLDELIVRADRLMYENKRIKKGR